MTQPTFTDLPLDDDDLVDLPDLSRPLPKARFRLGPDRYSFAPRIPVGVLGGFIAAQRKLSRFGENLDLEPMFETFGMVMPADDVTTLRARCVDTTNPIDHVDLMNILNHMLEVWGMRPTQPSSPSTTTSDDGTNGMPSTPGASPEASPTTSDSTSATGSTSPTTGPSSTSNPSSTTS